MFPSTTQLCSSFRLQRDSHSDESAHSRISFRGSSAKRSGAEQFGSSCRASRDSRQASRVPAPSKYSTEALVFARISPKIDAFPSKAAELPETMAKPPRYIRVTMCVAREQ